jgi:hypothetical protein
LTARLSGRFAVAALGLVGIVLVVFPAITHGMMPGDTVDARFNQYLLEHFYQWITGKSGSFWDAGFFYPFPHVVAFSDNHLGEGFIFAILRGLGFDPEDAFRGWYLGAFIADFAACAFTLRRLGYGYLATGAGAFLFTFGLPVTAQEAHAQLIYRFGVPLAALALIEFGAKERLRSLGALAFWTVWQFYCSIYVGYFLSLLLVALTVTIPIARNGLSVAALTHWPKCLGRAWKAATAQSRLFWTLIIVLLAGILGLLLARYAETSALYGFRRSPDEIESMLPRLASYLYSTNSLLWRFSWFHFRILPMAHEHAMFVGAAPFLAIAAALLLRRRGHTSADSHFLPALGALLLMVASTLLIQRHSLYQLVETAPGVNAIRAVTRIIVVLLFPFAILLASGLESLMRVRALAGTILAGVLVALTVFESAFVGHYVTTKTAWQERLTALQAQLPQSLPSAPILMVGPSPEGYPEAVQLDAMLLAQRRGWQTLDGYSASPPPGYDFNSDCSNAARNIVAGLNFIGRNTEDAYQALAARTVRIGYDDCDAASITRRPSLTAFAGPLPAEAMAKTAIEIAGIRVKDGMLHVALSLRTEAAGGIPAITTTGTPVRLSARYLAPDATASDAAHPNTDWQLRQNLTVDIAPGGAQPVDLVVPPPAASGTYRIGVTLVQDGVAWFHDRGLAVAISRQTVTLDGAVRIGE